MADGDIELIEDEDGLAVLGEPSAVERFLTSHALPSFAIGLERLRPTPDAVAVGAAAVQAAATIAESSGRWVKLTPETVALVEQWGLMAGPEGSGLSRGIVQAGTGQIKGVVQFSTSTLANPAVLAGVAGIMAQIAVQQQMRRMTEYLAVLDEKVDDVLRAQKDAALAEMIGVDLVLDDATTVRDRVGRVSATTWSKVQGTALTVGRTQAYALRQLDAIAERIAAQRDVDDLAAFGRSAPTSVREWLAVLAHCLRLQDALAVLELDRVLEADPDDLDRHRSGLRAAKRNRTDLIVRGTDHLLSVLTAAADRGNRGVLLNPLNGPAVVRWTDRVAADVIAFRTAVGVEQDRDAFTARSWGQAADDARSRVLEAGADGLHLGRRVGLGALSRVRSATNRLASEVAERTQPRPTGASGATAAVEPADADRQRDAD